MKKNARSYLVAAGIFVPHWLLVRTEISHGAKLTYARLVQKVDARGIVRPHLAKLAAHLGSEVQQVMLFLVELEKQSLIEIQSPLVGASSLCCLLPDHLWMDRLEPGTTNGSRDYGAHTEQSKSHDRSHDSGSNRQTDKFKSEGATPGNGKSDDQRVRQPRSKFPYETCLEHAIQKKEAGELIRNERGLANYFYWTGEQDEEIARGLASDDATDAGHEPSPNVLPYKQKNERS
jgi:hypothetical protein